MATDDMRIGSQGSQSVSQLATQAPSAYTFSPPPVPTSSRLKRPHDLVENGYVNEATSRKLAKLSDAELNSPSRAGDSVQKRNNALFSLVSPSMFASKMRAPHVLAPTNAAPQDIPEPHKGRSIGVRMTTQSPTAAAPSADLQAPASPPTQCHRHAGLHFMQSVLDDANLVSMPDPELPPEDAVPSQSDMDQTVADFQALCAKAHYADVASKIKALPASQTRAVLSRLQARHLRAIVTCLRPNRRALRIHASPDEKSSEPIPDTGVAGEPPPIAAETDCQQGEASDSDHEPSLPSSQRARSASPDPEWSSSPPRPQPIRETAGDFRPPESSYEKAPSPLRPVETNERLEESLCDEDDSSDIEESVPYAHGEDHFTSSPPEPTLPQHETLSNSHNLKHQQLPLDSSSLPTSPVDQPRSPGVVIPGTWHAQTEEHQLPENYCSPGPDSVQHDAAMDIQSSSPQQPPFTDFQPSPQNLDSSQEPQASTQSQDWKVNTQNQIFASPETLYRDRRKGFFEQQARPLPASSDTSPENLYLDRRREFFDAQKHPSPAPPATSTGQASTQQSPPRTSTAIFSAFQTAYPEFEGTQHDFTKICQELRAHGSAIHTSLLDDFVLVVTRYRKLDVLGPSSDPFSFYAMHVAKPQHQKGVLTATTLRIAAGETSASPASRRPLPWTKSRSTQAPAPSTPATLEASSAMPPPPRPASHAHQRAPRAVHSRDASPSTLSDVPPTPAASLELLRARARASLTPRRSLAANSSISISSSGSGGGSKATVDENGKSYHRSAKNDNNNKRAGTRAAHATTPLQAWARDYTALRWHAGRLGSGPAHARPADVLAWGM